MNNFKLFVFVLQIVSTFMLFLVLIVKMKEME